MARQTAPVVEAVIFDLDGVLLDSEQLWDLSRREVVQEHGGRWLSGATEAMQGMSSTEWSAYLHDQLGVRLSVPQISREVVDKLLAHYQDRLPLVPGAAEAVHRMAERWPLGLASSSNRPVIDAVLARAAFGQEFRVTISSEEVGRGKPAPDVYLEAARHLGFSPSACGVVEDSANGIRAGVAAGMTVVAIPNPHFRPPDDVLALAKVVLPTLEDLTSAVFASRP
jgi:HAD superfamily hydrolase (TIGR01509 family)